MPRQPYTSDGELNIYPISDEDRADYIELQKQINGGTTLFVNPLCKDIMWESVVTGEVKTFSIYDKNGDFCGSIELQHPKDDIPEIGISLVENKRNRGIAPRAVKLVAKRAYSDKKVEYFLIRISSNNLHSKHVFEKMGVVPLRTAESNFQIFMKSCYETLSDDTACNDLEESFKLFFHTDFDEVVCEYKLTPEIFL